MGLGCIGRRVAEIAVHGLGMKVLAYDPYVAPDQVPLLAVTLVPDLETVLRRADFVSLHVSLVPRLGG